MAIHVYQVQSTLSQVTRNHTDAYLKKVSDAIGETLSLCDIEAFATLPFGLVFVASGGSEGLFLEQYEKFAHRPCYILTSGESNSLAASMEILSYLHQKGKQGEIIHGSIDDVAVRISQLRKASDAIVSLKGTRSGVVGKPSSWLIASSDNGTEYANKLGIELVHIPIEELVYEHGKEDYPKNEHTAKLLGMGYDSAEMARALNVYGALLRLVEKYQLNALTVRCFHLLETIGTTGCVGLAILNAQGICAGCEGDVPSLISMQILNAVSGESVFLCNPSRIDTNNGEMVLAHCTLPLNMPSSIRLMTHYESDMGVALAGHIPQETATIFKTSSSLERYYAKKGTIIDNLCETHLCRTQIKLKLDDFTYFLKRPINNHHLVCLGDHTGVLEEFFIQISGGTNIA